MTRYLIEFIDMVNCTKRQIECMFSDIRQAVNFADNEAREYDLVRVYEKL